MRKWCGNPVLSADIQISERDISLSEGYSNIAFQYLIIDFGYGNEYVLLVFIPNTHSTYSLILGVWSFVQLLLHDIDLAHGFVLVVFEDKGVGSIFDIKIIVK